MKNMTEGWAWLKNSRKWHYFNDGRSLCRNFMLLVRPHEGYETGNNDSPDNCKACAKKADAIAKAIGEQP